MRGSPQNTYLVIVEAREVPPTAEIARFGRYTACWRESELSQPRPFPVPPLPQFGSPVRGQSRALMRVLNCLDCTAGYPARAPRTVWLTATRRQCSHDRRYASSRCHFGSEASEETISALSPPYRIV